ncbi:MAG: FHA domain-containing protein [Pirellulales bacterium]|nr:FHA domain-containing protein [Pirellulales bacterium]
MIAKLVSDSPLSPDLQIVLEKLPAVIGRGSEADIRLEDRWLSRIHCRIDCQDGILVVRDLESKHGTLVNGQYVQEASLTPGDRLAIGLNRFRVCYQPSPAATVPAERGQ